MNFGSLSACDVFMFHFSEQRVIVSAYIEVSTTYLSHLIFDISHTNTDIVMSTPFPLPASACRVAGSGIVGASYYC